jgi:hypothetical protein
MENPEISESCFGNDGYKWKITDTSNQNFARDCCRGDAVQIINTCETMKL